MADVHELLIRIDRDQRLEPQVDRYRARGVPWKIICPLAGRSKRQLESALQRWRRLERARGANSHRPPPCA